MDGKGIEFGVILAIDEMGISNWTNQYIEYWDGIYSCCAWIDEASQGLFWSLVAFTWKSTPYIFIYVYNQITILECFGI